MRLIRRVSIARVSVVLSGSIVIVIARYETKRNADRTVRLSYELFQQGQRPTLEDIMQRFGGELKQTSACKDFGCGFEVVVSNGLLARLHLAKLTTLTSEFWVRDGLVDENVIEFWTIRENGQMILEYTDAKYCNACNDLSSGNSINIDLGSQSIRKRGAFGLNTNCLLSVRGCAAAAELLPTIQRD